MTTTRREQSRSRQPPLDAPYPTARPTNSPNGTPSNSSSNYPSLQHPSIVPLQLQGSSVELGTSGSKVVKKLKSSLTLNETASKDGALIFGVSSSEGPTSMCNVSIGQVSSASSMTPGAFLHCHRLPGYG